MLLEPGRRPKSVTEQERQLVIEIYGEYLVGPRMIEQILEEKGVYIPRNRIRKILLEEGLSQGKNKRRRRRWMGCERKHSLSLTHRLERI